MPISPAAISDAGGIHCPTTSFRPEGTLKGGGYDPKMNTLYTGPGGHPDGMAKAGGNPSITETAGITTFETGATVFWANDSLSLPRALTDDETEAIQQGLENAFDTKAVIHLAHIADVPPSS